MWGIPAGHTVWSRSDDHHEIGVCTTDAATTHRKRTSRKETAPLSLCDANLATTGGRGGGVVAWGPSREEACRALPSGSSPMYSCTRSTLMKSISH